MFALADAMLCFPYSQNAYLYRTATNLLRDRWRKQKRERKYSQTKNFSEAVSQNLDMHLDGSSFFEKLSAMDRATLWLAHVEHLIAGRLRPLRRFIIFGCFPAQFF